jgi:hypothetical protein
VHGKAADPFFVAMVRTLITNAKALVGTHAPGVTRLDGALMAKLPQIEQGWLLAEHGRIRFMTR